jgi:hypothetical protein
MRGSRRSGHAVLRHAPLARRAACATVLAALAAFALSLGAAGVPARAPVSHAAEVVADLNPEPPHVAYVTETAASIPKVWLAAANGGEPVLLGPGEQPLLAPDGRSVAVSMFGTVLGVQESGPAIGIYPAAGATIAEYLSLAGYIATPVAWSQDSTYLAVEDQSTGTVHPLASTRLDVIDTVTGAVTTIAKGAIYGASFARDGSDRLVFGLSHSESFAGGVNLYVSEADGAGLHRITSDGHSLFPVWGPSYIAYDRERTRKLSPEYQIWLASTAGVRVRKVTHIAVGALAQGLVPLAFSADGARLIAEFEGEDQSDAYAVNVATGRARPVIAHGNAVIGAGISADGSTLLVDENAFEQSLSRARIATIPFAGGRSTVIVAHGSQASWND